MEPAAISREMYAACIAHWGEPGTSFKFQDTRGLPPDAPRRIDVMVWHAEDDDDITLFATIGLSAAPLPKSSARIELHLAIRGQLSEQEQGEMSRYLANFAVYPFEHGVHIDWWHRLLSAGGIPKFPGHTAALLHPKFVESGLDEIATSEGTVRILNVVPLLPQEAAMKPISALREYFEEADVDLFSPRETSSH